MTAPRLFGTDGVRGRAGEYPLDRATVRRIGAALVRALPRGSAPPRLLVGRDTRESGGWIEAELATGASGESALVTSAGVVPTPAVAYLTRAAGYDAGILSDARSGLRRRHRDLGVAQSVRRQRHQGVLRTRRKIHRAG
jgi:phosphoglucosamine mutase